MRALENATNNGKERKTKRLECHGTRLASIPLLLASLAAFLTPTQTSFFARRSRFLVVAAVGCGAEDEGEAGAETTGRTRVVGVEVRV